jgi:hypothetical protein
MPLTPEDEALEIRGIRKLAEPFARQLREIIPEAERADEYIEGAEWVLSRDPTYGTQLNGSDVWFLPMENVPDMPSIVLYYTFDDERVYFISIEMVW